MTNDRSDDHMSPSPSNPDSRLRALDKLLGTWSLKHRAFDTGEEFGTFFPHQYLRQFLRASFPPAGDCKSPAQLIEFR